MTVNSFDNEERVLVVSLEFVIRTMLCWLAAYITVPYFFIRGLFCHYRDPSKSLSAHYHDGARLWATLLLRLSGIQVTISNPEALDSLPDREPFIVASNHQSLFDIPILLHCLPMRFAFVAKRALFWIPIFGRYLEAAGYIPVNRREPRSAYRSIQTAVERIKSGISILIFPEGSRSANGELGRFKGGILRLARMTGSPVLPVAIRGSFDVTPKGSLLLHPAQVTLTIGTLVRLDSSELEDHRSHGHILDELRGSIDTLLAEAS